MNTITAAWQYVHHEFRFFTELIGDAVISDHARRKIVRYREEGGVEHVPYFTYGMAVYILIVLSVFFDILILSTDFFSNFPFSAKLAASFLFVPLLFILLSPIAVLIYKLSLEAKHYHRQKSMEEHFPEFLAELSLNLRAGQSLEDAFTNSTEKEFGVLSAEMQRISKKVKLGVDIDIAIKEFSEDYHSDVMNDTFELIVTSWNKGVATAKLVDRVYDTLQMQRYLSNKIVASVSSYRIFLATVTIGIAPAMFALSFHLINLMRSIVGSVLTVSTNIVLPVALSPIRMNDAHYLWFAAIAIVIMSSSTAIIAAVIKSGSIKEGIQSMLLYAIASLASFWTFLWLFDRFFTVFAL